MRVEDIEGIIITDSPSQEDVDKVLRDKDHVLMLVITDEKLLRFRALQEDYLKSPIKKNIENSCKHVLGPLFYVEFDSTSYIIVYLVPDILFDYWLNYTKKALSTTLPFSTP